MKITRTGETTRGPAEWFTGIVFIDPIAVPANGARIGASNVHFTPGARTAWHTHPHGQSLFVLEGVGLVQRRRGAVEIIRAGDRVAIDPGEEHWHGASPARFMTHVAMHEVDEGGEPASWGDHVTDEEYAAAPPVGD